MNRRYLGNTDHLLHQLQPLLKLYFPKSLDNLYSNTFHLRRRRQLHLHRRRLLLQQLPN
jgi:hypothetical protein